MSTRALRAAVAAVTLVVGATVAGTGAPPAGAEPAWAPAATATVHPGVQMFTDGAQCTANFVYTGGADVYIGYAAHCAGTGSSTDTDGCVAGTHPIGTPVEIAGASRPGTLAYSSWAEMQSDRETDADTCAYNDFALVRIDPADHDLVNPSVPHWGGPTALNAGGTSLGATVHSYGNSSLRQGLTVLSPKTGVSLGTTGGGWSHPTYTVTPGIPGDSGSALLDGLGQATGVLSTLTLAPLAGSNSYADLAGALAYMRAHNSALSGVQLAVGTEAFNGAQLPVDLPLP
jgi:hypothetical protein